MKWTSITITIEGPGEKRLVSGTLFEGMPRIVKLRDYQMDFRPEEHMLLLAYGDRPGIIGKIGTILGQAEINIASMNLGRREKPFKAICGPGDNAEPVITILLPEED